MTVALAELAMQRIVIPRGEILYAGSSPVGHQSNYFLLEGAVQVSVNYARREKGYA